LIRIAVPLFALVVIGASARAADNAALPAAGVAAATRARIRLRNVRYDATLDPMLFAVQHLDDRIAVTTMPVD